VRWQSELSDVLAKADGFVLVVDPKPSHVERFEWSLALQESWTEQRKRMVPVFFEDVEVPAFLRGVSGISAQSSDSVDEDTFAEVLQLLNSDGDQRRNIDQAAAHRELLDRLGLAIDALSQEELDEDEMLEHRESFEGAARETTQPMSLAMSYLSIGLIDLQLNDAPRALSHLTKALGVCEISGAPEYPSELSVILPLSHAVAEVGELNQAVELLRRGVDIRKRHEGVKAPGVVAASQELGVLLVRADRDAEAREILEGTLDVNRNELGPEHPRVSANEYWLALACERLGDHDKAKELFDNAASAGSDSEAADPQKQIQHLLGLGRTLTELGDMPGAREVLSRTWQLAGSIPDTSRALTAACAFAYGMALLKGGDCDGAIDALTESIRTNNAESAAEQHLLARHFVGVALRGAGKLDRAQDVLAKNLTEIEGRFGSRNRRVAEILYELGLVERDRAKIKDARECLQRAVEIESGIVGDSDPRVLKYRRALARLSDGAYTG